MKYSSEAKECNEAEVLRPYVSTTASATKNWKAGTKIECVISARNISVDETAEGDSVPVEGSTGERLSRNCANRGFD